MIETKHQYEGTKRRIAEFERALGHSEDRAAERPPLLQHALRRNVETELQAMYERLAEYEAKEGIRPAPGFDDPAQALIRARIVAGLTQEELAERVGVSEMQFRRYEATGYADAPLHVVQVVAAALSLQLAIVRGQSLPAGAV